jgi:hypothetical protein
MGWVLIMLLVMPSPNSPPPPSAPGAGSSITTSSTYFADEPACKAAALTLAREIPTTVPELVFYLHCQRLSTQQPTP